MAQLDLEVIRALVRNHYGKPLSMKDGVRIINETLELAKDLGVGLERIAAMIDAYDLMTGPEPENLNSRVLSPYDKDFRVRLEEIAQYILGCHIQTEAVNSDSLVLHLGPDTYILDVRRVSKTEF